MGKETITLDDIEIEKRKFYHCKNLFLLEDVNKARVSSMLFSSEKRYKYFIGYKDDDDY